MVGKNEFVYSTSLLKLVLNVICVSRLETHFRICMFDMDKIVVVMGKRE